MVVSVAFVTDIFRLRRMIETRRLFALCVVGR